MVMPKARQMGIAYDHLMDQTAVFNSKGKKLRRSTVPGGDGASTANFSNHLSGIARTRNMSRFAKPDCGEADENEAGPFLATIANRVGALEKKASGHKNGSFSVRETKYAGTPPTSMSDEATLPRNLVLDQQSARIALRTGGKILLLDAHGIIAIEARGNYVMLRRQNDSYLLRGSISRIAEKLRKYGFLRIHRSVLVNRLYVEDCRPWPTGEYELRLTNGKMYTLTRTYKAVVESFADLWL